MLNLARDNAAKAGAANAEFLHGHIESIPLHGESVDVIISNCVLSLSANKAAVSPRASACSGPAAGSASPTSSPKTT